MKIQLGVLMDPIENIHYKKDSTLAMLWEAEKRGFAIFYFGQKDIFMRDAKVYAKGHSLKVFHDPKKWFEFGPEKTLDLAELDILLMRKDPPFNIQYVFTTHLLDHVEKAGVLVVNKPQSLRDANEKLFTSWFPECTPPTLISRSIDLLQDFFQEHKNIVCKPLDAMGGFSIFHLQYPDKNAAVIFETLTESQKKLTMVQRFIPEITKGDKRILMINGEPVPFALARIPAENDWRGNLAAGAKGVAQPLSDRDRFIAETVGPVLRAKGIFFAGLDVIGDFLTEINVTSPTCIRELDEQCKLNISAQLFDCLEKQLS